MRRTTLITLLLAASAAAASGAAAAMAPMPLPPTSITALMTGASILDPDCIPKYADDLVLPPAMPATSRACRGSNTQGPNCTGNTDTYVISVRQIEQTVLPTTSTNGPTCTAYTPGPTTVFAYGTDAGGSSTHNWPGFTIEATRRVPTKVTWVNELVDDAGNYLPHLLQDALDQTLHWANPAGLGGSIDASPCMECVMQDDASFNCDSPDCERAAQELYTGPVPIVVHVHGHENVPDFSDGYSEAWFMPDANLTGADGTTHAPEGTWYGTFRDASQQRFARDVWSAGNAIFNYPNTQRSTQLWYHDHVVGITRLNVYAGMAGLYQLRSNDVTTGPELPGLPFPPPGVGFPDSQAREIPLAIQDRAFDENAQLFYPVADIPAEDALPNTPVPPQWIPEFAATLDGTPVSDGGVSALAMVVNGKTWPKLSVVREPYRLRLLNGCNARALVLYFSTSLPGDAAAPVPEAQRIPFNVIGNEAGFFPSVVAATRLLLGPAERYDLVLDFSQLPADVTAVYLLNEGPEGPFTGANLLEGLTLNTVQVMRFDVAAGSAGTPFNSAAFTSELDRVYRRDVPNVGQPRLTRRFTLIERAFGDNLVAQYLGLVNSTGGVSTPIQQFWEDPVTTNAALSSTEDWQFINLTPDSHPIHIHEFFFQVISVTQVVVDETTTPISFTVTNTPVNADVNPGVITTATGPCPGGVCNVFKDTFLMPPGAMTTVRLRTGASAGLFQWHCHLLEHEDNEMMRPWCVGQPRYIDPQTGTLKCPGPPGANPI